MFLLLTADKLPDGFPQITQAPSTKVVEIGHNTVLLCSAIGTPSPEITWVRDMMPVNTGDNHRYRVMDSGALQITSSEEVDGGKYECVAENTVGTEYSQSIMLYVKVRRVPPQFSIPPPPLHEVMLNADLNLTCVAVGSPMPFVKWRKGLATDITPEDKLPIGRNVLELTNIQESANYTCVAASALGLIEATTQIFCILMLTVKGGGVALPGPPTDVQVSDITATTVRLTWTYTGSESLQYYVIQYKPKYANHAYTEISGIITMYYTIRNLSPYSEYEIFVIAVNNIGRGPPSSPAIVTTGETARWRTNILHTGESSHPESSRVIVHEAAYYRFYQSSRVKPTSLTLNTSLFSFKRILRFITRPIPNIEIQMQFPLFGNKCGKLPKVHRFTLTESSSVGGAKPGTAPRNVQVRPLSSSTMVIQWDEPETPNGQVTGYKVYYTTNPSLPMASWESQMVDNNQLTTISELTPHTIYTIKVQAFTSVGPGPLSLPVLVKTQQGVPSQPSNLRASEVGETSVTLTWSRPSHSGENIISYELYWNDTYAKERHHRRITITESYSLTGLYPNTLYYVWLAARSQRGEGATTPPIPIRTKQYGKMSSPYRIITLPPFSYCGVIKFSSSSVKASRNHIFASRQKRNVFPTFEKKTLPHTTVPGAPPQSVIGEAVGPTSIRVSWSPPPAERSNGRIIYYKLQVVESGRSDSEALQITLNGTSFVLDELKRWTEYRIWVLAGTSVGDGPPSYPITIRTLEDALATSFSTFSYFCFVSDSCFMHCCIDMSYFDMFSSTLHETTMETRVVEP
ncbi:unnamed protein product, partial [Timema podura]|nr:unnamed protein product [Timema podura]